MIFVGTRYIVIYGKMQYWGTTPIGGLLQYDLIEREWTVYFLSSPMINNLSSRSIC